MRKISACTFVKDTFVGGWPIFEAIASILPFVDEYVVLDLGSTDPTYDTLCEIARTNKRIRVLQSKFTHTDANAFADAANECVRACEHDVVLFHQADEVWHQNLLELMDADLKKGVERMSFWRYQLRENLQTIKWYPHPVQRLGLKSDFEFIKDGMNPHGDGFAAPICGNYDGGYYLKWGKDFETKPETLPTHEMILDVSKMGMFRDNIVKKHSLHAPMWHESNDIEGMPPLEWIKKEYRNPNWRKTTTPFNIPYIMTDLLGTLKYELRDVVKKHLLQDTTRRVIGL